MTTETPVPAEVLSALQGYERILLVSHLNPDGDATGSSLAMAWTLRALDKQVLLYNANGFPGYLDFLPLPCPVLTDLAKLPCDPQLIVALDCGGILRPGEAVQPLLKRLPSVCIDHHLQSDKGFGSLANWVEPDRSSTGEMAALIARALGAPLQGALAEALYVAISSDTGNFSFGNTTPTALEIVSELTANGLNIASVREKLENNWTEAKLRLWGRLMQEARLLDEGRFAASIVTPGLLSECHAAREDTEGFVEHLRRLRGVRVALLLREEVQDGTLKTKASMRSSGNDDVGAVAARFGGGGHRNAAGATLAMDAENAFAALHPVIRSVWNG